MTLRLCEVGDLGECADLLFDLFQQDHEFEPDRALQLRGLTAILGQPETGTIFVAADGSQVVGMVSLLYGVSTALGGPVATLEDLVVRSEFRGRGWGRALARHAVDHARARGCLRVTLLTDHDNHRAQELYRGLGFVRSSMVPLRLVF